jgi:hypothetical protein
MKGLSFQNGVEYKINIDGESWSQGDSISVTLESKTPSSLNLFLAEGVDKKVKAKSPDAFTVLEKFSSETSPLKQTIALPLSARISDKSGSLYVLYGKEEQTEKLGQLRLNVIPHLLIRDFIDLMTAHFRFAQKTTSAGKNDEVEVKLDPSGSKEWASLEQLLLRVQITEETMEVYFQFHRSEVDPTKGGLSSISVKREVTRTWNLSEIVHDFNQRLNKEVTTAAVEAVFAEYRSAGWLAQ